MPLPPMSGKQVIPIFNVIAPFAIAGDESTIGWEADATSHFSPITLPRYSHGRGCGVGRSLGIGFGLGVGVGRIVAVGVGLGVAVGVGVTVGVGVGVGTPP